MKQATGGTGIHSKVKSDSMDILQEKNTFANENDTIKCCWGH